MKVIFSRRATRDLEEIADYIAADNPQRAASFVRELVAKAQAVGQQPYAHPLIALQTANDVRRRIHGKYAILYQVGIDSVMVMHILHVARDIHAVLSSEE